MAKIIVVPTGRFPLDRDNIQDAVFAATSGDTILLKAKNEFGVPTKFNCGESTPIDLLTYGAWYSTDVDNQTYATRRLLSPADNPGGGEILRNRADQFLARKIYVNKSLTIRGELVDGDDGDYDYSADLRLIDDWTAPRTFIDGARFDVGVGNDNTDHEDTHDVKPTVHFKKLEIAHSPGIHIKVWNGSEITVSRSILRDALRAVESEDPTFITDSAGSGQFGGILLGDFSTRAVGVYTFDDDDTQYPINTGSSEAGPLRFTINRCKLSTPAFDGDPSDFSHTRMIQPLTDLTGTSEILDCTIEGLIALNNFCRNSSGAKLNVYRNVIRAANTNDPLLSGAALLSEDFPGRSAGSFFGRDFTHSSAVAQDEYYRSLNGTVDLEVDIFENIFHSRWPLAGNNSVITIVNWDVNESTGPTSKLRNNVIISGPTPEYPDGSPMPRMVQIVSIGPTGGNGAPSAPCTKWEITDNTFLGQYSNRAITLVAFNPPDPVSASLRCANHTVSGNDLTQARPLPGSQADYRPFQVEDSTISALTIAGMRPNTFAIAGFAGDGLTIVASGVNYVS